jgi:hypothetical protein
MGPPKCSIDDNGPTNRWEWAGNCRDACGRGYSRLSRRSLLNAGATHSTRDLSLPHFPMRRGEAAASPAISETKFDEWSADGKMPKGQRSTVLCCGRRRRRERWGRPVAWPFSENTSFHLLQQPPRFIQQCPDLLAFGDGVAGEQAVPARVLVSAWRAGSGCAAVHAAAPFAAYRRRAARSAGAGLCPATRARQHRTGIAGVIAQVSAA